MPASVVGSSRVEESSFSDPWIHPHLLPDAGGNTSRRGLIYVHTNDSTTDPNSVDYGGETANFLSGLNYATGRRMRIYQLTETQLTNLTEGASHDITVDWSSGINGNTTFILVKDATQDPLTVSTQDFGNTSNPSINLTIPDPDTLLVDQLAQTNNSATGTADSPQTTLHAINGNSLSGASYKTVSANTTMSWTLSTGSFTSPGIQVVHILPGITVVDKNYSDDSAGSEQFNISKRSKTLSDQGSANDIYTKAIAQKKDFIDLGSGTDILSAKKPLKKDYSDIATGFDDLIIPERNKLFTDPGSGSDIFTSIQPFKKDYFDISTGSDAFTIPSRKKTYSDIGTGEDTYSAKKPLKKDYSDIASGTDQFGLTVGRIFSDIAAGNEHMYKFVRKNNDPLDIEDPIILFELYDD